MNIKTVCLIVVVLVIAAIGGSVYFLMVPGREEGPTSYYEPPINIFIPLHIDPDPSILVNNYWTTEEFTSFYENTRDEIIWLMDEAETYGVKYTALFTGYYMQETLRRENLEHVQRLLAEGHEVGTHVHEHTYDNMDNRWVSRSVDSYEVAAAVWRDSFKYVDDVLDHVTSADLNKTVAGIMSKYSDERTLMHQFGFEVASGNRSEDAISYFGHIVWNPWRAGQSDESGRELEEKLNTPYVSLDHFAQIGKENAHGVDCRARQLKRQFIMLYIEWLSRERSGAPDKVWTWGAAAHPSFGDIYNTEIADLLSWLDEHFIGKQSPRGNLIARYATASEIASEFKAWEQASPGASSFSYIAGNPYPYTYEIVPTKLDNAEYEKDVALGANVTAFKFLKADEPIYVAWSNSGARTVDFSGELAGNVKITTVAGQVSTQSSSSIQLAEEPIFIEKT